MGSPDSAPPPRSLAGRRSVKLTCATIQTHYTAGRDGDSMAESMQAAEVGPSKGGNASRRHARSDARRIAMLLPVLIVFLSVLVGGHWYLIRRLVLDPGLPEPLSAALVFGIGLMGSTLVLQPIAERTLPARTRRIVAWPASIWMGLAFLLLMALLLSEMLMLLVAASAQTDSVVLLAARVRAAGIVGLVLPTALLALRQGLALPSVKRIELALARWPRALDGFRIVQISDIHFGSLRGADFARWLVEQVNRLSPDLVAITGDLVDGPVSRVLDDVTPLEKLRATHGAFFVTGNHDHYSGAGSWAERIAELGIRVLRNEHVTLLQCGARIEVAGVDDHQARRLPGEEGEDLDGALASVDPDRALILLAHDPSTFKQASKRGVDLQLSGHTHGGQLWPFNFFVKLVVPFVAGIYRRGAATLYVSRGTGFWGPPMRLRAPAEITEIVLRTGTGGQASCEPSSSEG